MERLKKQIEFILEVDKLKRILRQSILTDGKERENDAEHSWHISLMAILLLEHSNEEIDVLRVIKMLLIHDIVEIDAGDTYCYDKEGHNDKREREEKAAKRIFGMLPKDQCEEMISLWDEFEQMETAESKYAASLDRLQPLLLNYATKGKSWRDHGIESKQIIERNAHIDCGSKELWEFAMNMIDECIEKGYLEK
ncbi:putative hydrolases of HD superfamily [Peptoclostridium litorale DSM 5388]|uniref:Hydrolase n=1 Tax=Peptoclostridium litorale DSM 5388 TaxID=1121324 RepID=A0A069RHF4_PEPLI|nr:HD domain-containing protein [Peptoclostridium litorale]KDR96451.1 hydrolase [Peptoclostridium litorale DSM 5388]SIN70435.1 putative hydrolases of HD superfamily [Peptoclostridium litorale DSM 5388]